MLQSASNMQWLVEDDERRIKDRFAAPCLGVRVRRRGWLRWRSESIQVTCLDINRYGMALLSQVPFNAGTRLTLDFDGKYITQSNVSARVLSVTPAQSGYRLGLQFCYCMDRSKYSRAVDNALSRIEALYRKRKKS